MKPRLLAVVAILVGLGVAGSTSAGGEKKKTEVEGTWKLAKGNKGAPKQFTFTGNNFAVTFADDSEYKGTLKLNTEEIPSWMDITFVSGPDEKFKGKVAQCIYSFEGGFTWCATMPGRKRRPQEFVETMGDLRLLLGTYEREKK